MDIQRAFEENSTGLNEFFESLPIDGSTLYRVLRPLGFFEHAKQNFEESHVLQMQDDEKNIHGCLSINVRDAWIQTWKKVGWATDLRISTNRQAVVHWFDYFLEEIRKVKAEHNIDHIFSFINKTNTSAFNTFIRPRVLRPTHPRFHLLANFFRISVFSNIPIFYSPLNTLRIHSLNDSNIEALAHYLKKKNDNKVLAYKYSPELILDRLKKWKNFNKENFLIAYDAKENIVGCVAPWNTRETQRYQILGYNDFYENMRKITDLTSFLRFTKNMPPPDSIADFYFLTHLRADNPYIFHRLLHEALEFCGKHQYLIYSSFEGDRLYKPPRDVVYTKSKFGLYLVLGPHEDLPFTHISQEIIPDFEVAFL